MTVSLFPYFQLTTILNREGVDWAESLHNETTALRAALDASIFDGDGISTMTPIEIAVDYITGTIASPQTLLTARAEGITVLKSLVFTNPSGASVDVSVWLVSSGDTVGDSNLVIDELAVPSKGTVVPEGLKNRVMNAGTLLRVAASTASAVNVGGSYLQRTQT